jgi:cullin-4
MCYDVSSLMPGNVGRRGFPPASGGPGAAKKLVIKPFKVAPKVPENISMETWEKLKSALVAVYTKSSSFMSKEELYRVLYRPDRCSQSSSSDTANVLQFVQAVEDLCVQKQGARIYDLLVTELQTNISAKVRTLAQQVGDSRSYMALVDGVWGDHVQQLNTIRNIFLYLDR